MTQEPRPGGHCPVRESVRADEIRAAVLLGRPTVSQQNRSREVPGTAGAFVNDTYAARPQPTHGTAPPQGFSFILHGERLPSRWPRVWRMVRPTEVHRRPVPGRV